MDVRRDFLTRMDRLDQMLHGQPRAELMMSFQFFAAFRHVTDSINDSLAEHGLNLSLLVALISLYASPDGTLYSSQLCSAIYSARTNITRITDELARQGWVDRTACPEDRRRIKLKLTEAGRQLTEQVLPEHWARLRTIWHGFSTGEAALFGEFLDRLAGNRPSDDDCYDVMNGRRTGDAA